MIIRTIDEDLIDVRTDRLIKQGLCICFPEDIAVYSKTRAWNDYNPSFSVVIEKNNAVIAHAAIIEKTIFFDKA